MEAVTPDYVIVCDASHSNSSQEIKDILFELDKRELQVAVRLGRNKNELLIMVRCPDEILQAQASNSK